MLPQRKVKVHEPYAVRVLINELSSLQVAPEAIGALIVTEFGDFDDRLSRPNPIGPLRIPAREHPTRPLSDFRMPVRGNRQFQDSYQNDG